MPRSLALAPYRSRYGDIRPRDLDDIPLPPRAMPRWRRARPLKSWRYVGVYGPELMLCAARVQVGPATQSFWAIWDREARVLRERTRLTGDGVRLGRDQPGRLLVVDDGVEIDLALDEIDGVETVCPVAGGPATAYAWTRKQGGVRARGAVRLDGEARPIDALAVIDDSAGYHARRTAWRWCAGVGRAPDGRAVAWNLVAGINDPSHDSERTVWVEGVPREVGPVARFADDLSAVATDDGVDLRFTSEAVRARRENLLLVRSEYRQPFGAFAGTVPGPDGHPLALAEGWGVMEEHAALW